ncbi:hypothetical protein V5O48_000378 [Marasmius crinis-equi]|uniref:Amidase domain-containing protein n=1 Tax=Marasmius crinis-equi TaxID=585013 RepID=A0ABR3G1F4_9AGAR
MPYPDLYEASVLELRAGLDEGLFSSVDLVEAYFARIEEVNLGGPALRAVLEINPSALDQAKALDEERKTSGKRSLLHGIPILLKDSIATVTSEGKIGEAMVWRLELIWMNTTAGSFALLGSVVAEDAGVVKRLRKAGAIILGKPDTTENTRFEGNLASGWSGRGGQSTSAYFPNADPSGSSSGCAIAASIGLATVTIGADTHGSITCPASNNNVVGIKPTVGLTSRAGVIPISTHMDSIGSITRSVSDAAIVLSVIAGRDPNDVATLSQPDKIPNYPDALNTSAFKGKRIGVPRKAFLEEDTVEPSIMTAFEEALGSIERLGASIVDPADLPSVDEIFVSENETVIVNIDFKIELNDYLRSLSDNPTGVHTLSDLIAFNDAHPELEKPDNFSSQSGLLAAQATDGFNSTYYQAVNSHYELGRTRGIDAVLKELNLDALVLPATVPATTPPAIAGYPIVTVPLGFFPDNVTIRSAGPLTVYPAPGVPFGLSFLGGAFSEFELLGFAFAYEQETRTRLKRKAYPAAVPKTQLQDIMKHH